MEISGNSLNQPVNFYGKNTGNNINMAIDDENRLYQTNVFSGEFAMKNSYKNVSSPIKKKRKSKRLNTIDTDYLPYETEQKANDKVDNFFIVKEQNSAAENIKKRIGQIVKSVPLINYFFLKNKQQEIYKTVETLNDINQNVDDLLNTVVPYGEEEKLYKDIAENLTNAANILGKANKNI